MFEYVANLFLNLTNHLLNKTGPFTARRGVPLFGDCDDRDDGVANFDDDGGDVDNDVESARDDEDDAADDDDDDDDAIRACAVDVTTPLRPDGSHAGSFFRTLFVHARVLISFVFLIFGGVCVCVCVGSEQLITTISGGVQSFSCVQFGRHGSSIFGYVSLMSVAFCFISFISYSCSNRLMFILQF